jgi:hypothetical protein
MDAHLVQIETWRYTAKWSNGCSKLSCEIVANADTFDEDERTRRGLSLYQDISKMLGYEPFDYGVEWERIDDE